MVNRSWMGALVLLVACGGGAAPALVAAPARDGGDDAGAAAVADDGGDSGRPAPEAAAGTDGGDEAAVVDAGGGEAGTPESGASGDGEPCDADVCYASGSAGCTNGDYFGCTPDPTAPLGTCPGTPNCLGYPTSAYRCGAPPPSPELIPGCMAPNRGAMPDEWCCAKYWVGGSNGHDESPFCPTDGGSWSPYSGGNCQ